MKRWVAAICAALALAGCGTSSRPPAAAAARLVPADALAYIHLSLDARRPEVQLATQYASGLPGYARLLASLRQRLSTITDTSYATGIRPWLGDEAAVGFLPDGDSATELILLSVRNAAAARRFLVHLLAHQQAPAARLLDGFVVLGTPAAVAQAATVLRRPAGSLAASARYRQLSAGEPSDRVLDAYLSDTGISELLAGHRGLLGTVAAVLGADRSVAAALSPTGDGGQIWTRSSTPVNPPSPASSAPFKPSLQNVVPADTTLLIDTPDLERAAPGILGLAPEAGVAQGLVGLFRDLGRTLQTQGTDLAPLFSGEGGLFALDGSVGVIAHVRSPGRARLELADAVPVVDQLFAPSGSAGVEPETATREVNGVAVTTLTLSTTLSVSYAVFRSDLVIATGARAVIDVISGRAPLSSNSAYQSVLGNGSSSTGPVMFVAISRIVRLASLSKLLAAAGFSSLAPALEHITALGLHSTGGRPLTTAELYFTIP